MKNVRTMLATLSGVFLLYGLFALIAFQGGAALGERTLHQLFQLTYFVILVMGVAMLLVAILLTVAMASFKGDKDEEEEDEDLFSDIPVRPARPAPGAQAAPANRRIEEGQNVRPIAAQPPMVNRPSPAQPARAPKPFARPLASTIFAEDDGDEIADVLPEEEEAYSRPVPEEGRRCVFCGEQVSEDETFCPYCGKKL